MKSKNTKAEVLAVIEEELFVSENDCEALNSPLPDREKLKTLEWRCIRTEPRQLELFEALL
jgi:hypothetical protein